MWRTCTLFFVFFFFQAEDGIRDVAVTGVQTCALPLSPRMFRRSLSWRCNCRFRLRNIRGEGSRRQRRRIPGGGDRESGVEGKRGVLGGRRIIKKKKKKKKREERYNNGT